jgi:hypothetical protein
MRTTWRLTHILWKLALTIMLVKVAVGLIFGAAAPAFLRHIPGYPLLQGALALTILALLVDIVQDYRERAPRRIFGSLALAWLCTFWLVGPFLIRVYAIQSLTQFMSGLAYMIYASSVGPGLAVLGLIFDKDGRRAGTALVIALVLVAVNAAKIYGK